MALDDLNKLQISFKKLLGKAHTQEGFAVTEESISSNVSISYETIFGEEINPLPKTVGGLTSINDTDGIVEYLRFEIDIIPDTQIGTNQSQGYALKLPAGYNGVLSPIYSGGTNLYTALGKLQVVPSGFGTLDANGASEYDPILYQSDGVTEITKFDSINWNLDPYNGILFVQDPTTNLDISPERPTFLDAFLFVGTYLNDAVGSGATLTNIENVGSGEQIFVTGTTGITAQFRSIIGSGDTNVFTSGDTIVVETLNTGITAIYTGASPSNVEVGGVVVGTDLTGRTLSSIVEEMLVTTFTPTFVNPSNTFSDDQANTQETGSLIPAINFTATFDQGQILLQGVEQAKRSGFPNRYIYTGTDLPSVVSATTLTNIQQITNYTVLFGNQVWTSEVKYDEGPQPLDSNGLPFGTPLPSGTTTAASVSINGIYPYFFGTVASGGAPAGGNRPDEVTSGQTIINAGTKIVASSNGTITVNYSSTSDDYIWFATPETSTTKTVWFETTLNNGIIGGPVGGGNLFPSPTVVSIDSPTALWSSINYKIYISNFQTAAGTLEFRNS